ncbi:MAG: SPOR domain-containing protein, partial [Comamonadaceae bacterium]
AALQLDLLRGVAPVEIERITNADIRAGVWRRPGGSQPALASAAPRAPAASAAIPQTAATATTAASASAAAITVSSRDANGVPVAWATPISSNAQERRAATAAPLLLAQAAVPNDGAPPVGGVVVSDTTPPPRFGSMQTQELAPLSPASPVPPAATESAPAAAVAPPAASPPVAPPPLAGAAPMAAMPAPASTAARGVWLQLGAFRELAGARTLQERSARALPALTSQLRVFSEGDTHRLQAGPYPSRDVAQDVALQLRNGLGLAPIVIERR